MININMAFPIFCVKHSSKPEKMYEDPQLQDNSAYGTASAMAVIEKGEVTDNLFSVTSMTGRNFVCKIDLTWLHQILNLYTFS